MAVAGVLKHSSWSRVAVASVLAVALSLGAAVSTAALLGWIPGAAAEPDFVVTSTVDAVDAVPGDGACATSAGQCTLRAAIQEANAHAGHDVIEVRPGNYVLSLGGAVDPVEPPEPSEPIFDCNLAGSGASEGDLDVTCPVTIVGAGQAATIVDGGTPGVGAPPEQTALDRLLEIHPTAGSVTISGLTLRGGYHAEAGGAIANSSHGTVRLQNVSVLDSYATNAGGGIYSGEPLELECPEPCAAGAPRLELINSTVSGNTAGNEGGGVYVQFGTLSIAGGTISDNLASSGGGLFNAGETSETGLPSRADLSNVTVTGNTATGAGGGIFGDHEGSISLSGVTLSANTSFDYGGGLAVVSKASLTMSGGTVADNVSTGEAGGLYTGVEGAVTITDVLFSGNRAGAVLESVEVPGEIVGGEGGGGGAFLGGSGSVTVSGADFVGNTAVGEGGGLFIENNNSVAISDGEVRDNFTQAGGGGIENAGNRVSLSRMTIHHNRAVLDGGGIEGNGSGAFTLSDSMIYANTAENGGGFANGADGTTRIERTTIWNNRAVIGINDDTGLGGGVYGLGDGTAHYENVTIVGNFAQIRGGGLYIDADADVHVENSTISRNVAPAASGVGDEGTDFNVLIEPSLSVLFRNSIVAGNLLSPNCNFALGSLGGNMEDGDSCYFRGARDRQNATDPGLDAVADNGGAVMTMALRQNSYAVDGGVTPCPATDARGVARPLNGRCDIGAFEFEGPFPPPDNEPPDTEYLEGPIQDTEETSAFRFTGTDNVTPDDELLFECRLLESDVEEPPEPVDPTEPLDPEFMWLGCPSPWQVKLVEEGLYRFEVRAIDRAGNVDPEPDVHIFGGTEDFSPPDTFFTGTPTNPSSGTTAVFGFSATDNTTPAQWMEYECRIDTGDPEAWLECTSPVSFSNLTMGQHTVQVRAADGNDNVDPTPATYTWTVAPPVNCDQANITLFAEADSWIDEANTQENFGIDLELTVRSQDGGEDARTLVRFAVPTGLPPDCQISSARLRLYSEGETGRTLEAVPLAGPWQETQVTWINQPGTTGSAATTTSGVGYREWDVTAQVSGMIAGTLPNHGFLIRDAAENDPLGAEQSVTSRHLILEPPETQMPQLVLRFGGPETPPPAAPGEPAEKTVVCGEVITESTRVMNDLFDCPFDGLIIGAPDVELDLNGHTIDGLNYLLIGQEEGLPVGVRNVGNTNVHIHNGTVQEFGSGVQLMAGATFNVVENLVIKTNAIAGVELWDADDGRNGNVVRDNTFVGNGEAGVWLLNGTESAQILNNTFDGNAGVAIYLLDAHGNRIEGNRISGVVQDPNLDSDAGVVLESSSDNAVVGNTLAETGDAGVLLTIGSHRNLVEGNTLTRTGDAGVTVEDSDGNQIVGNIAHLGSDAGVVLSGANNGVVRDNDVRFNPTGVDLSGSSGNLIQNNNADYSDGAGVAVGADSYRNDVVGNFASNGAADGISVEGDAVNANGDPDPTQGNLIEGNTANANLGDGINVAGVGHTIGLNTANSNAGYGIAAAEGNFDEGGNTASGNGEPEQCVGVVCGPGTPTSSATPDVTAPDTSFVATPPNGHGMLETVAFTFTGTDNIAPPTALRFECRLDAPPDPPGETDPDLEPPEPGDPDIPDAESWVECANPVTYYLLTSGEHVFEVRAIDPFDNVDLTPAVYTWTVIAAPPGPDSTAPNTTIFAAPSDPSTRTKATFRFGGSDNAAEGPFLTYECRVDNNAFSPCVSPVVYEGLALGEHTFRVRAIDPAGNEDASPATHVWEIVPAPPDETAPETTIESGPDLTTVETEATLVFTGEDEGDEGDEGDENTLIFECKLDAGAWEECASPKTYAGLAVGGHTFSVRAVDAAENDDESPATYAWSITAAPVPTAVSCGQVLTQSVRLINHLIDCPGDGLVIGAPNITVDLNGHTIDGTGLELAAGIRNNGHDSVTITNGVVQEFDFGVLLNPGTAFNIVSGMTVQLNLTAGIQLSNADDGVNGNIVRANTAAGNDAGIILTNGTQHALLLNNTVSGSAGFGIYLLGGGGNRLQGNLVALASDTAINLEGSSGNVLVGNHVVGAADAAFMIQLASNNNLIQGNLISDSEAGIHVLDSNGSQVIGNTASGMSDVGVNFENAQNGVIRGNDLRFNSGGISLSASSGNLIEDNDASEGSGTGISIGDLSLHNVVRLNRANANDAEGIYVADQASAGAGNLIDRNQTNNNIADGIHVGNIGHILVGNTANHNGGWGIYAAQATVAGGNIDGGTNTAIGNVGGGLDPFTLLTMECFNIVCDGGEPMATDPIRPETWTIVEPANPTTSTSATFRFDGIDNATPVEFECRLDSIDAADFLPCVSPITYGDLTQEAHTFEVRAVDFLGNVDASPAVYTWQVVAEPSGVPPVATIVTTPDSATLNTSAAFAFSANEEGAGFECKMDGGAFEPCASPRTYTGLAVGTHTFQVRAIDSEDLVSAPVAFAWRVTAAPVATAVTCGRVLTQSTLVTNDLIDCPGNGLVIGAHGITVDLGGHTIDGIGQGVGILNNGFDSVAIVNGAVQEFDYGVQLNPGTTLNVVSGLTMQLNEFAGLQLSDADNNTLRHHELIGNGSGVLLLAGTQGAVVRDSTISGSPKFGIHVQNSHGNRIESNQISASSENGVFLEGATNNAVLGNELTGNQKDAVYLDLFAHNNRIEDNTISGNSGGVWVSESDGVRIIGNVVHSNDGGIFLELSDNGVIRANDVRINSSGIELKDSNGNLIQTNTVSANSGPGIAVDGVSLNNDLILNVANGNDGEGIAVGDQAPSNAGALVDRNIANGNGGDGIFVAGGHTLSDNQADFNDGWGIYAEQGRIDGGGNKALGNSEPQQCSGIVCEIGENPSAPNTTIESHPTNPGNSRTATFTFVGTDDTTALIDLEFECRLDSQNPLAFQECELPMTYTNLAPGTHTFDVRAVDLAEHVDPTPDSYTWTYVPLPPGVAPDTIIEFGPPDNAPLFDVFFKFFSNEPDVTFQCSLDGAPFVACANEPEMIEAQWFVAEYEFEEEQVGQHTFRVRAVDPGGLPDPTPAVYTWNILGVMAVITAGPAFEPGEEPLEPASGGETEERTATFEFHANVADAVFECSLDLGVFAPCASPVTYQNLAAGEHIFLIVAIDPEGEFAQLEPTEYEWTILPTVDAAPPNTQLTDTPANGTAEATFSFTGSDDVTASEALFFECRLDSVLEADYFECLSPFNLYEEFPEGIAPGQHTFHVRAVDLEDNVDPTPANYTWTATADTTPPTATILTTPDDPMLVDEEGEFTFAGSDNATPTLLLTFECVIDEGVEGAVFEECESPYQVQGLLPGEHVFRVRSVDLAGNAGPAVSHTWTVVGPPDTTITVGPPATTTAVTATFEFAADQSGVAFACSLNGSAFQPCDSPLTLVGLGGGAYTLEVEATNDFAQVEEEPAVWEWTVDAPLDTSEPDTTIVSGPPASTTVTTAVFTFVSSELGSSFECALAPVDPTEEVSYSSCESPAEYTELAGGPQEFRVRAIDLNGNVDPTPDVYVWTVLAPPVTTIVTGPEDGLYETTATFEITASVPGATFYCALDVPPFEECTSPVTYEDLGPGEHEFVVFSVANGFTDSEGDGWDWEILDPAALQTTLTVAPPAESSSTEATFEFAASLPDATFECSLDGAPFAACESPTTLTGLDLGEHTFRVRAVHPSAGTDPTPATYTWTVVEPDTTAPETTITEGPPATTVLTEATFRFTANEPGSTFECALDGEPFEPCVAPYLVEAEVGPHSLAVRAVDPSLNPDPSPAVHPWTIVPDTTAPETTILDGPLGLTGDNAATFNFTGSDDGTIPEELEFECALDGEPFAGCASPHELQDLPAGEHTLQVRAIDEAENVDQNPASRTWTVVDVIAPETSLDLTPEDPTEESSATFEFTGEELTGEAVAEFECALDDADFAPCASPLTLTGLSVGLHIFQVRAVDLADNVDPTPEFFEWVVVSPNAPETTIVAGPDATSESTTAIFIFGSDQPEAVIEGFECALDGGPFESCESPHEITGLALGGHVLAVRAIDVLDRVDETPASHPWTIVEDTTPLDTEIEAGPADQTENTEAVFVFAASDPTISTFECSLDGGPFVDCESPYELQSLTLGQHTLVVRAVDDENETVDETPATDTWEVIPDLTPLDTTILSGPEASTRSTSAIFTFASNEAATFECALDGISFSSCVAPHLVQVNSAGEHTLLARAKNTLTGEFDETPAAHSWTVEPAPTVTIDAAPPATTESTSATFAFSSPDPGVAFECALDAAELFTPCTSPATYTGLTLFEHEFRVQAVVGPNELPAEPVTHTWEIGDATPPVTTIDSAPAAETASTSATFAFSATGGDASTLFQCSLDSAAFVFCASPQEYIGLAVGDHTFEVQAVEGDLIVEPVPVTHVWTVLPPNTPAGSNVAVATGPATLTFAAVTTAGETTVAPAAAPSEPLPGGFVQVGADYYEIASTATFAGQIEICLTYNPADFTVPANVRLLHQEGGLWVDRTTSNDVGAGRVCGVVTSLSPFAVAPVADLTPPETTIGATPAATTTSTSASFTFSANETGATYACSLDGAAFVACASPRSYTGLSAGGHTFEVRATDASGNVDPTPAAFWWTVSGGAVNCGSPITLTASADAWIDQGSPSDNKGSDSNLKVMSKGPSSNLRAFVRFNLPTLPAGCTIESATLRIYSSGGASGRTIQAIRVGGSWTESGVTWGNQPGTTGTAATATSGSGYRQWTVTGQVQGMYAGGNNGFLIRDASENQDAEQQFFSREKGESPPQLVISFGGGAAPADTTPPLTTIGSGPAATTESVSASFTFSSNESGVTYTCSLDGAAWTTCASPKNHSGLGLGSHTFRVRATDAAGNTDATPASHTWSVVDTTPPTTSITAGPAAVTESTSAVFTLAANEASATFTCALDGADFAACAAPASFSGLAVGEHTLVVRATDPSGNVDATPATRTWTIVAQDTTPPATSLATWPAATTSATNATFTFSAAHDGGYGAAGTPGQTFACSLDGAAWAACASPKTYTGLAIGDHEFRVRATDQAGNVDQTPAGYAWEIVPPPDTTAPNTTIASGPAAETVETTATIAFSANESGVTFACELDGAAIEPCQSPVSLTGLPIGAHTFAVAATDAAGNTDATPATRSWTVVPPDTTAPVVTITDLPNDDTSETSATFAFSADETATFACALDGGSFQSCNSPRTYDDLALGEHTVQIRATDAAGNTAAPVAVTWTIVEPPDTTAPQTALAAWPAETTTETTAEFAFVGSDNASNPANLRYECRLDPAAGSAWEDCANPRTVENLALGDHRFEARAVDQAGNTDATPAIHTWTVVPPADTTPPDTTISTGPESSTASADASFAFSSEAGATFECRLDGLAFAACTSPHGYSGLSAGAHTFEVRALDAAGNADPTPAAHAWTVTAPADSTLPETTLGSGPAGSTTSTSAFFTFSASEPATFECAVDGNAFAACASPAQLTGQGLGGHTFRVRATDAAGNVDQSPADWNWTVTAPVNCGTTMTLNANADAWIDQGSSNSNKGTDSILKVMSKGGNNLRALVKFTLPTNIPAGCEVDTATLRLFAASARTGRTLQAIPIAGSWTEGGVKWSNQPGATGTAATTTSGTGWRQWDVTSQVDAMYGGTPNNGFLIRDSVEGQDHEQQFNSREKSQNRPQLVLTFKAVDTTPPDTAISTGPGASTPETTATIAFSAEAGATFECALDGGPFDACTSPASLSGLTAGPHTFAVRAVDTAGNVDPTPAQHAWTVVDQTAPETQIVSGPPNPTESVGASFSFSATEPGTFQCTLDGSSLAPCVSPLELNGLGLGEHTFAVVAIDAAGNADPSAAIHTWTVVDGTPPETTIAAGPASLTASTSASFIAQSEPGATFECSLDGAAFGSCPAEYTGLADGSHTVQIRAADAAGNVDPEPAVYTWTVDATAPETTIDSAATAGVDATFTFSASESPVTYECWLDGAPVACTSGTPYTGLPAGEHTFEVRATDAVGNADPSPAVHTWVVEVVE